MKIFSKDLLRALQTTAKAVTPKPVLPAYECFRLKVSDGMLGVSSSDGNMTLEACVPCEGELSVLVPARNLLDYIKALPECEVELEVSGGQLDVKWANGHSSMPSRDISEWPEGDSEEHNDTRVPLQVLKSAILHVINSCGNNELRPVMNGIYFDLDKGHCLVATDGHICATFPFDVEGESFIMPACLASFIKDIDCKEEEAVIGAGRGIIQFTCGNITAKARKVEGRYPNYQGVFPQSSPNSLTIDRRSLIGALRRVSVCASKTLPSIKITLGDKVEIASQDVDFSISAKEKVEASYDGSPMEIGFNCDILLVMLNQMTSDTIEVGMAENSRAAVFTGDGSRSLLMPVILQ